MRSIETWHFRWPWVTFEGHFGDILSTYCCYCVYAADARSVCDDWVSCVTSACECYVHCQHGTDDKGSRDSLTNACNAALSPAARITHVPSDGHLYVLLYTVVKKTRQLWRTITTTQVRVQLRWGGKFYHQTTFMIVNKQLAKKLLKSTELGRSYNPPKLARFFWTTVYICPNSKISSCPKLTRKLPVHA